MMKLILFTLIFAATLANAQDQAKLNLEFKRFIEEDRVDFTDDRRIVLIATIMNLEPSKKYEFSVEYGFAGEVTRRKDYQKKSSKKGIIKFDKLMSLMRFYRHNKGAAKVFTAVVHVKNADERGGFARRVIDLLVMPNSGDPIYRVISNPICQYQGETRIDSEYHFNELDRPKTLEIRHNYTITRGFRLALSGTTGPTASLTNIITDLLKIPLSTTPLSGATTPTTPVNTTPLSPSSFGPSASSLFIGASYSIKLENRETFEIGRSWKMFEGQGGYIFRRNAFTRYLAIKFVRQNGKYVPKEQGFFDMGRDAQDFSVVPRSLESDLPASINFIDSHIPRLNTCPDESNDIFPSIQVPNEELQIMFLRRGDLK